MISSHQKNYDGTINKHNGLLLIAVFYDNGVTFPGLGALIAAFYDNGVTFPGLGALIAVFYDNRGAFLGLCTECR